MVLKIESNSRELNREIRKLSADFRRGAVWRGSLLDTMRGAKKRLPAAAEAEGINLNSQARIRGLVRHDVGRSRGGTWGIEATIPDSPITRLHHGQPREGRTIVPLSPQAKAKRAGQAQWSHFQSVKARKGSFSYRRGGDVIFGIRNRAGTIEHWALRENQPVRKQIDLNAHFEREARQNLARHIERRLEQRLKRAGFTPTK